MNMSQLKKQSQCYPISASKGKHTGGVYVIADNLGIPVYVGKSRDISKRIGMYRRNKETHNKSLKDWIDKNKRTAKIYIYYCADYDDVEKEIIKENHKSLFNISHGEEARWYEGNAKVKKPWVGMRGKTCPSAMYKRQLQSRFGTESRIKFCNEMKQLQNDKQRAIFEVLLGQDIIDKLDGSHIAEDIKSWFAVVSVRLIKYLEGSD
jgi:hypothetical protein